MKKTIIFTLIGLIFLTVLGVIFLTPQRNENGMKNPEKKIIVRKSDESKEISLSQGDTVQIELEGNGGTGYWWYVDNLDNGHLQLISEDSRTNNNENKVGAPVIGVWIFKAIKTGKTDIKLDYYRTWEGKDSAVDHFSVRLDIH